MGFKENIDTFELYTFSVYLYAYGFFYKYISHESFLNMFLLNFLGNMITYYFVNYNFLSLIGHNYWRNNINDIAMPQLITCGTNILINTKYTFYVIIPINILSMYSITKIYKKEFNVSKNLRIIITILFFIYRLFF